MLWVSRQQAVPAGQHVTAVPLPGCYAVLAFALQVLTRSVDNTPQCTSVTFLIWVCMGCAQMHCTHACCFAAGMTSSCSRSNLVGRCSAFQCLSLHSRVHIHSGCRSGVLRVMCVCILAHYVITEFGRGCEHCCLSSSSIAVGLQPCMCAFVRHTFPTRSVQVPHTMNVLCVTTPGSGPIKQAPYLCIQSSSVWGFLRCQLACVVVGGLAGMCPKMIHACTCHIASGGFIGCKRQQMRLQLCLAHVDLQQLLRTVARCGFADAGCRHVVAYGLLRFWQAHDSTSCGWGRDFLGCAGCA